MFFFSRFMATTLPLNKNISIDDQVFCEVNPRSILRYLAFDRVVALAVVVEVVAEVVVDRVVVDTVAGDTVGTEVVEVDTVVAVEVFPF
jgi:uncharacterized protein YqfB (UPF0267 family)